jgi:hypothetical protein
MRPRCVLPGSIATGVLLLLAPRLARAEGGSVYVTLDTNEPSAALFRQIPSERRVDAQGGFHGNLGLTFESKQVCVAPCGVSVPAGSTLAVGGLGFRQSRPFVLTGENPSVKVNAQVGTENAFIGGIFLGAGGGLVGLVGLGLLPAGFVLDNNGLKIAGGVMLVGGAVALVSGIMMAAGSETKITLLPSGGSPRASAPRRRSLVRLSPAGLVF